MGGSIKLSPEVIATRELARIEQQKRPISDVIKEMQKQPMTRGIAFITQSPQKKNQ